MRLVVEKKPLRRILTWVRRALSACAVLLLGILRIRAGGRLDFSKARESADLDRLLREQRAVSKGTIRAEDSSPKRVPAAAADGLIGRI